MRKSRLLVFLMTFISVNLFFTMNVLAEEPFPYAGVFATTDGSALIYQIEIEENEVQLHLNEENLQKEENAPQVQSLLDLTRLEETAALKAANPSDPQPPNYLEDLGIDYESIYREVAELITPEMSREEIDELIDQFLPAIEWVEKADSVSIIARNPQFRQNQDGKWRISLWNELFLLVEEIDDASFETQNGVVYESEANL